MFAMTLEQNKAMVRRFMEEAFNQGNLATADELLAPNYRAHDPTLPTPVTSRAAMKQFITGLRTGLPDVRFTIEDMVAEADRVVYRWSARATQRGPFMGIPPTGKPIDVTGIGIARLVGSQLVEEWVNWDALGLLQQVGAIPAPRPAAD